MKDNGYRIFRGLDDETVDRISEKYPVLTDRDREQLFSKSEKKYNKEAEMGINNVKARKIVDDGDEVSGVDRYTGRMWRRYAAMAAAFVLVAGGIGGSVALAKHISKNRGSDEQEVTEETSESQTTDINDDLIVTEPASDDGTETTVTTTAEETTTEIVTTTFAADDGRTPADLDGFAQQWLNNYMEITRQTGVDSVQHDAAPVTFRLYDGSEISAYLMTEAAYPSAEGLAERFNTMLAPGYDNDKFIPDLTHKIDDRVATREDFTSCFFTYNDERYVLAANTAIEGERVPLSAERISENEMLVHWYIQEPDMQEGEPRKEQTMHLVWVDECSDWRADDIVDGSRYFGKPTEDEAKEIAKKVFSGYAAVHNAYYSHTVGLDTNFQLSLCIHTKDDPNNKDYLNYIRVDDPRFSTPEEMYKYFATKYTEHMAKLVIGKDLSAYPDSYSFLDDDTDENACAEIRKLNRFIVYNGDLYVCSGGNSYSRVNGILDLEKTNFDTMEMEYHAFLNREPEIVSAKVINGNMIVIGSDEEAARTECEHKYDSIEYCLVREDSGEWKVSTATPPVN